MFLTRATLLEMTGLKRPSAICRFLDGKRVPYLSGADGWPRVLEEAIVNRLGGKSAPVQNFREPKLRLRNG